MGKPWKALVKTRWRNLFATASGARLVVSLAEATQSPSSYNPTNALVKTGWQSPDCHKKQATSVASANREIGCPIATHSIYLHLRMSIFATQSRSHIARCKLWFYGKTKGAIGLMRNPTGLLKKSFMIQSKLPYSPHESFAPINHAVITKFTST